MARELKDFLYQNMYRHYRVVRMANKARRFVIELFQSYVADPDQLPTLIKRHPEQRGDSLQRIVCDYIAGMTDRYALEEYRRQFSPDLRP